MMKRLLVLCCSAGLLLVAGCGNDNEKLTPETIGKQYMEKRFSGAEANLTSLSYTVVDEGDEMATIVIEGAITYKEQIKLKMTNGKWAVAEEVSDAEALVVEEAAPAADAHAEEAHAVVAEPAEDLHVEPAEAVDAEPAEELHAEPVEEPAEDLHVEPAKEAHATLAKEDTHAAPATH